MATVGWQDRDYYRGGGGEDYLSNPAAILSYSVPFGTWFGVRVRLHFWLLLTIAFAVAQQLRSPLNCSIGIGLLVLALLVHDFAHRAAAIWLGGRHDEFMLWPVGGLIFPSLPSGPGAMFIGYAAPIAVHAVIATACIFGSGFGWSGVTLNPLAGLNWGVAGVPFLTLRWLLYIFGLTNWMLILANLLPYYWFDGGCILQSILRPFADGFQSINITCWVGMILAVPMTVLSLMGGSFLGLIMWVLLFSSSYTRRRQLQAQGADELSDAIAFSASQGARTGARSRRWFKPDVAKSAAKRNAKLRREAQQLDQILAKVSKGGMQSLNWWEKRTLRKASEEKRKSS